jgi:hypothetical protein
MCDIQCRVYPVIQYPRSKGVITGDDSRFFALLGSAPQELNTARPEAKLQTGVLGVENCTHEIPAA